jgi:hypothetical protein
MTKQLPSTLEICLKPVLFVSGTWLCHMAHACCACDQVDGPHHWLANSRTATGETLGRRRLLAARGWAVVSVPYFAWPAGGLGEKQLYMHEVRCTGSPDQEQFHWSLLCDWHRPGPHDATYSRRQIEQTCQLSSS